MAATDTVNFIRSSTTTTLAARGGAWTVVLTGALSASSLIEVNDGEIEYLQAQAAPATTLIGHRLLERESQNIATVAASDFIYARAVSNSATLVVTPGAA